jgi:hypothetical protein
VHTLLTGVIPKLEVPPLERDGVVNEVLRSTFETIRDSVLGGVMVERIENVSEYEGGVPGWSSGEYGGQSGEGRVGANSGARDGAIGEDENGGDGIDAILDLSDNTPPVELVLSNPASVCQPGRVEDANLGKRLHVLITFKALALTTTSLLLLSS